MYPMFTTSRQIGMVAILLMTVIGCGEQNLAALSERVDAGSPEASPVETPLPSLPDTGVEAPIPTTSEVFEALHDDCVGCHHTGSASPIFGSLNQFETLVASNADLVNPNMPQASRFYRLLVGEAPPPFVQMPPSGPPYASMAAHDPERMSMGTLERWISTLVSTVPSPEAPNCDDYQIGPAPVRRLTRQEYQYAVSDLFGVDFDPTRNFPPQTEAFGFDNNADYSQVSRTLAEQYFDAADEVSSYVISRAQMIRERFGVNCNLNAASCVRQAINNVGRLVFRRPVTDEEGTTLLALHQEALAELRNPVYAFREVLQAMLLSPHFLYRPEVTAPGGSPGQEVRVGPYEMASRLSFFLWSSGPDAALLDAADDGLLDQPESILETASRMLDDPKAERTIERFYPQWLRLTGAHDTEKDPVIYPMWTDELAHSAREETLRLLSHLTFEAEGRIEDLLTTDKTVVNHTMGDFYGLDVPDDGNWHLRELDGGRRPGVLTRAAFLSHHAKADQSSPILRGVAIREQVLCQPLAPPPQDVDDAPPALDPNATTRERFAQHTNDPNCAACHGLIDPIGFGLENFDGIGRHREEEHGLPIDTEVNLIGTQALNGTYADTAELSVTAGQDEEVQRCVVRQWNRFAQGRSPVLADQCVVAEMMDELDDADFALRDIFLAVIRSRSFQYRVIPQ